MDTSGIFGLDNLGTSPMDPRQRMFMAQMLMNHQRQGNNGGNPYAMANSIIAPALSAYLMNQKRDGSNPLQGITNGVGNWFNGYNWNGTAGDNMMQGLNSQAQANMAGGAAL